MEPKFNVEKSVFKDFKEDTPARLMKMLEKDLSYGKLEKFKSARDSLKDVKNKLFEHYLNLKNIFTYYAANSSYPTIGLNDMTEFTRRLQLFGPKLSLARMD